MVKQMRSWMAGMARDIAQLDLLSEDRDKETTETEPGKEKEEKKAKKSKESFKKRLYSVGNDANADKPARNSKLSVGSIQDAVRKTVNSATSKMKDGKSEPKVCFMVLLSPRIN